MKKYVIDIDEINIRIPSNLDYILKKIYDDQIEILEINCCTRWRNNIDPEEFGYIDFNLREFEHIVELKISAYEFNLNPENLPKNLKSLYVEDVHFPVELKSFPKQLEKFIIINPNNFSEIEDTIPPSVTSLEISRLDDLNIERFDFSSLKQLTYLKLTYCSTFEGITNLPDSLTHLEINPCGNIINPSTILPINLKTLILKHKFLEWQPPSFPASLTSLTIISTGKEDDCKFLLDSANGNCLKENYLNDNIQELEIGIPGLKKINNLPSKLTSLTIHEFIPDLPTLPSTLKTLSLNTKFETFPILPIDIKILAIHGDNLKDNISKLSDLEELKIRGTLDPNCLKTLSDNLRKLILRSLDTVDLSEAKLPRHLVTLKIRDCKMLKKPPALPDNLKHVSFLYCDALEMIPTHFPSSMEFIKLIKCSRITSIDNLSSIKLDNFSIYSFENLESIIAFPRANNINIYNCNKITSLPAIAEGTTTLRVTNCGNLASLNSFPQTLTSLIFVGLPMLKSIPSLSETKIIHLKIDLTMNGIDNLQSIESFPKSLKTLEIISSNEALKLPAFPEGLISLDLDIWNDLSDTMEDQDNLDILSDLSDTMEDQDNSDTIEDQDNILPALPDSLVNLSIINFNNLSNFSRVPKSLRTLKLKNCNLAESFLLVDWQDLVSIEFINVKNLNFDSQINLSSKLTSLKIWNCNNIESFPNFPSTLRELEIIGSPNLKSLPDLSLCKLYSLMIDSCAFESLKLDLEFLNHIILKNCLNLQFLTLPSKSLQYIRINNCPLLESLPRFNIDMAVRTIDIAECEKIQSIPPLPRRLSKFSITKCNAITSLDLSTAEELEEININNCANLESISSISPKVRRLSLLGCNKLNKLPPLPDSLEDLDLQGCNNLVFSEELIEQLGTLRRCHIRYPKNFFDQYIESYKNKIINFIRNYKSNSKNPPISDSFENLYTRYITENLSDRVSGPGRIKDKIQIIGHSTEELLKFIEKNPQHLLWIDEISKNYLGGCINQPVAGFTEINAFKFIIEQDSMLEKINAVQYLHALEKIKEIVKNNPPSPGIEIEAGNIALIHLYKILKKENIIKKEWPQVPDTIAFRHTIDGWIADEKVKKELDKLKNKIAQLTCTDYVDFLCEGQFMDTWTNIEFSEHPEIIEIKNDINLKYEAGEIEEKDIINHRNEKIFSKVKELTHKSIRDEHNKKHVICPLLSSGLDNHMNEFKKSISDSTTDESIVDHSEKDYHQQLQKELKNSLALLKFYSDQTMNFYSLSKQEIIAQIKKGAIENCSFNLEEFEQFIDNERIKILTDQKSPDLILFADKVAHDILAQKKASISESDHQFSIDLAKSDAINFMKNICQKLLTDSPSNDSDDLLGKIASNCIISLNHPKRELSPRGGQSFDSKKPRKA